MKLILVPPNLVKPMLAALRAGFADLPDIGGMPVLVSRHCPPDTGYILNGAAIPRVDESLWRNTYLGSWDELGEPEPKHRGMTFAIDYPTIIEWRPRPHLTRWRRLQNRIHWRVWMAWFIVRDWWHRMAEESRSPFQD